MNSTTIHRFRMPLAGVAAVLAAAAFTAGANQDPEPRQVPPAFTDVVDVELAATTLFQLGVPGDSGRTRFRVLGR